MSGTGDPVDSSEEFDAAVNDELLLLERGAGFDDTTALEHERTAQESAQETERKARAIAVLRRGLSESPELRQGFRLTLLMAIIGAVGRLTIPVLVQQVIDKGLLADEGFRPGFTLAACGGAAVIVISVAFLTRFTYIRLVTAAEGMLRNLRVRAFSHVHRLSMADHEDTRRGELTARVTSDIETIARFVQYGAIAWIVDTVVVVGTLTVMCFYAWQLAVITVIVATPILPLFRLMQRRQLKAYTAVRTRVSETMGEMSEAVQGAAPIRAYGMQGRALRRLDHAIDRQYRSEMGAAKWFAFMFPLGDAFGGFALASVAMAGVWWGSEWGLNAGSLIACLFLVQLILGPIAELGEILDQTQTAIAGWSKVLELLDRPIDLVEPTDGLALPAGPLSVHADDVGFTYRTGGPVLRDVTVEIPAGASVAIVGRPARARPPSPSCSADSPIRAWVRWPSVASRCPASIRCHGPSASAWSPRTASCSTPPWGRTSPWVAPVPPPMMCVGRWRSWVSPTGWTVCPAVSTPRWANAARDSAWANGMLILDEATSAVDPRTERTLTTALHRLAEGRTTVSVAHRLSTAEQADLVMVFDAGALVEMGSHAELVALGGRYAELYRSWLGNTGQSI
ncbi:MAG: ABC transporter ATP-binding protein [Actinobacteria bacterium]|nr:ABC transporter ATP-binding protein [Actinomycetota bacterium]